MFDSQSLSRNGPLGAIWVAAFCHKRLKKVQVTQTDIPSSIDKMLLDESDVITYRVLAFFLLGIVRIYSKKVEYLFNDCRKVLIEVKGFVLKDVSDSHPKSRIGRKGKSNGTITLPKRFELDAFDLEVVEECSRGNEKPLEDITLTDYNRSDSGMGQFFIGQYRWRDFSAYCHPSSPGHTTSKDMFQSDMGDIEAGSISDQDNRATSIETLRDYIPLQGEGTHLSMEDGFEKSVLCQKPIDDEEQVNGEKTVDLEDLLMEKEKSTENGLEESSVHHKGDFQEEREDDMSYDGANGEPLQLIGTPGEGPLVNGERTVDLEVMLMEKEKSMDNGLQENSGNHKEGNFQEEREDDMACDGTDGKPPQLVDTPGQGPVATSVKDFEEEREDDMAYEGVDGEPSALMNTHGKGTLATSLETDILPEQVSVNEKANSAAATPLKLPEGQGASTPEVMLVPTPTLKERVTRKRKRKRICLHDDILILSNKELRRNIVDSSVLVCKRRKAPHNAFSVWKAIWMRNVSHLFSEPVLSGLSPNLSSLFCLNNINAPETCKDAGNCEKLNVPEFPPAVGPSVEPKGIAPTTPIQRSSERRPLESPAVSNLNATRAEKSNENEQQLDFPWNREENSPCEGDNQEYYGSSERTKMVVKFLQRLFLKLKKGGEEEVLSLFEVSKGKTCRDGARLFYEILVLKSNDCIDVEQEHSYGDIFIRKLPELEQVFRDVITDCERRDDLISYSRKGV